MSSTWRKHLLICLLLAALTGPTYFLDQAVATPSGSNWITLDFRGLILWTYIALISVHIGVSSIALLTFPNAGLFRIHFLSMVLSVFLLVTGVFVYGNLRRQAVAQEYESLMKSRKTLLNVIELKEWSYFPDASHPIEIRVNVSVHQSGRFAGNVVGEQKSDQLGSTRPVFESTNGPDTQRQVSSGERFTYVFPLKIQEPVPADNVTITLYLFQSSGSSGSDITKIFTSSPIDAQRDDDGQYFYGLLPPPSAPGK